MSAEEAFIGGLHRLFEWAWNGPGRRKEWVGGSFIPARERNRRRQEAAKVKAKSGSSPGRHEAQVGAESGRDGNEAQGEDQPLFEADPDS